jgi:hypothetical protein
MRRNRNRNRKNKQRQQQLAIPRHRMNSTFVTRCVEYDISLSASIAKGFGWSPTYLWVDEVSTTAIPGVSDIQSLFERTRVVKVKMIVMPSANVHETTNDSSGTGVRNLPWLYAAPNFGTTNVPTMSSISQLEGLRIALLDKPFQYTIRPKPSGYSTGGVLVNPGDCWMNTDTDDPYYGFQVFIDQYTSQAYVKVRFNFIVTFECQGTK